MQLCLCICCRKNCTSVDLAQERNSFDTSEQTSKIPDPSTKQPSRSFHAAFKFHAYKRLKRPALSPCRV